LVEPFDITTLEDMARASGVDLIAIVQDYAVSAVLEFLIKQGLTSSLVFKGGTAIKKVYFPDARFSVDLDFDSIYFVDNPEDRKRIFFSTLRRIMDVPLGSIVVYEVEPILSSAWLFYNVKYRFFDIEEMTRIDIDYGPAKGNFVSMQITFAPYSSERLRINVYPIETILEQKIIALLDRTSAKDLWDIYFLVVIKNVQPGKNLREIVMHYDPEFNLRKILFIINEIVSRSDFAIVRDIYLPAKYKDIDYDTVRKEVSGIIEDFW